MEYHTKEEKNKIIKDLCYDVGTGSSITKACRQANTISKTTFFEWLKPKGVGGHTKEDAERWTNQYAYALNDREDSMFEELLEIGDGNNADVYIDDDGQPKIDGNTVQRDKLRTDLRKWMLARMNPKKYGDKIETIHKGEIKIEQIKGMNIT